MKKTAALFAAGGLAVGGKKLKVELFVEDNGGKADQSAAAAQKLITQEGVVAIIGPNASRYAIPASEIAESNQTVFITPWSTNPKTTLDAVTGKPKRYAFRSCFIDPFQGRVLARFAAETPGLRGGYRRAEVPGGFRRPDQERRDPPDQGREVRLRDERETVTAAR